MSALPRGILNELAETHLAMATGRAGSRHSRKRGSPRQRLCWGLKPNDDGRAKGHSGCSSGSRATVL